MLAFIPIQLDKAVSGYFFQLLHMSISFYAESVSLPLPDADPQTVAWLQAVVQAEGQSLGELTYIFCDDAYLHQMNVEHLQHDTLTDVITFEYNEDEVAGDVFISTERTTENAQTYGVTAQQELYRVMVHGLLHLLGYGDKTPETQTIMTAKEDQYLALWQEQYVS